jgi:hypothetical protein
MTTPAEIGRQPATAAATSEAELPSGPAAALILAGGIAVFCMGLVTTLGEASTGIADALQWNDRVGPLSGKTLITVIVFTLAWVLLAALWRRSNPPLRSITIASVALIVLGLVGTFPTFFQAFE